MNYDKFSDRKTFPGTEGGPFEIIVRAGEKVEAIPSILFALLLLVLASLVQYGKWEQVLILWGFQLGDWALMQALPRSRISFGPAKPPTLLLALLRLPFALLPAPYWWIAQGIGTVLVIYGFWIEPHRIILTHQQFRSEKLDPEASLQILHFGDLHMERLGPREERLMGLLEELHPDIILFSGDILSYSTIEDPAAWADARCVFEKLLAPLGVYFVPGSPPVDREDILPHILDGLNIQVLREDRIQLEYQGQSIDLIGLSCTHRPFTDGPKLEALIQGKRDELTILLYHTPDLAPIAAELGIDLQLSGHTHGGQVRLPLFGALYAASLYGKRFESGRYEVGDMTLYVTRGLGMEGKAAPRVRFLCPPEIVLWEITGEKSESEKPTH